MAEKRTTEQAYQIYQVEGHGYAVEKYTFDVNTDDETLNKLWKEASNSLRALTVYFDKKVEEGELEECDY